MNQSLLPGLIADTSEPLDLIRLGLTWGESLQLLTASFVLALALGLFMMGILRLINRDRAKQGPTVRHLCQAMGIDTHQRRLLANLAAKAGQPSAAGLLISRGSYDAAMQLCAPIGVEASQLRAVRKKIFGN